MLLLASPKTLSQAWSDHEPGEKQPQFTQVQEAPVSRCRAKSSDTQLHWHIAQLLSAYGRATGFAAMHKIRDWIYTGHNLIWFLSFWYSLGLERLISWSSSSLNYIKAWYEGHWATHKAFTQNYLKKKNNKPITVPLDASLNTCILNKKNIKQV